MQLVSINASDKTAWELHHGPNTSTVGALLTHITTKDFFPIKGLTE